MTTNDRVSLHPSGLPFPEQSTAPRLPTPPDPTRRFPSLSTPAPTSDHVPRPCDPTSAALSGKAVQMRAAAAIVARIAREMRAANSDASIPLVVTGWTGQAAGAYRRNALAHRRKLTRLAGLADQLQADLLRGAARLEQQAQWMPPTPADRMLDALRRGFPTPPRQG